MQITRKGREKRERIGNMKIAGLQKTTLLDYPGRVAATVFTAGCNFCCPFCHNGELIADYGGPFLSEKEVLAFLESRRGILTGVCITGGEPTLQPDLMDFLYRIKQLGYCIKLDTNGSQPEILMNLFEAGLIDLIAMDIKNSKGKYAMTIGLPEGDIKKIEKSVEFIRQSGMAYEFRTTVTRELHGEEDLMEIGEWIAGKGSYYLQSYEEKEQVMQKKYHSYPAEEMENFAKKLTARSILTRLRG